MIRLEDLRVGLQIVHNREPIELLYFERRNQSGELWRVRPLFTLLPEHPQVFRTTDSLSYLHTSRKATPEKKTSCCASGRTRGRRAGTRRRTAR